MGRVSFLVLLLSLSVHAEQLVTSASTAAPAVSGKDETLLCLNSDPREACSPVLAQQLIQKTRDLAVQNLERRATTIDSMGESETSTSLAVRVKKSRLAAALGHASIKPNLRASMKDSSQRDLVITLPQSDFDSPVPGYPKQSKLSPEEAKELETLIRDEWGKREGRPLWEGGASGSNESMNKWFDYRADVAKSIDQFQNDLRAKAHDDYIRSLKTSIIPYVTSSDPTSADIKKAREQYAVALNQESTKLRHLNLKSSVARDLVFYEKEVTEAVRDDPRFCRAYQCTRDALIADRESHEAFVSGAKKLATAGCVALSFESPLVAACGLLSGVSEAGVARGDQRAALAHAEVLKTCSLTGDRDCTNSYLEKTREASNNGLGAQAAALAGALPIPGSRLGSLAAREATAASAAATVARSSIRDSSKEAALLQDFVDSGFITGSQRTQLMNTGSPQVMAQLKKLEREKLVGDKDYTDIQDAFAELEVGTARGKVSVETMKLKTDNGTEIRDIKIIPSKGLGVDHAVVLKDAHSDRVVAYLDYNIDKAGRDLYIDFVQVARPYRGNGLSETMFRKVMDDYPNLSTITSSFVDSNKARLEEELAKGLTLSEAGKKTPTGIALAQIGFTDLEVTESVHKGVVSYTFSAKKPLH